MAITLVDHVTESANTSPSTLTINPAPVGDLIVGLVGVKPTSRTTSAPSIFSGGDHGSGTGGAGTNGTDTGPTRLYCWHRVVDGTEPGSASLTWTGGTPNPACQSVVQFHKTRGAAEDWEVAFAFSSDDAQSTGTAALTATAASDPGYAPGDMVAAVLSVPTDGGTFSAETITIPGCTVTGVTHAVNYGTSLGNDGGLHVWTGRVTGGASTGAPTLQCDVDNADASAGTVVFIRLREPAAEALGEMAVFDGSDWLNGEMVVFDGSDWT